jgi:hypothetical protein
MPVIENALKSVAEIQKKIRKKNREISLELLKELEKEDSVLNKLYELTFTNLDSNGNILIENVRFEGDNRKPYFNHGLLLSAIISSDYNASINLDHAYDELWEYYCNENSWISVGVHFLMLKKRKLSKKEKL